MSSLIVHNPHAATHIPPDVRQAILLSEVDLRAELLRMTDAYTDELFAVPAEEAKTIAYPVSRLVVDPERFEDDHAEPMSARGMGVIYTRTSLGTPLRRTPEPAERHRLLEAYYRPHHARLADEVSESLRRHGRCLIIDAHSFASVPLPYEVDQSPDRPDICIGTDDYHTPQGLTERLMETFRRFGYSVAVNRPYGGSLVPMRQYRKERRVASVMIEVNRGLYMDEQSGRKLARFTEVRRHIASVLREPGLESD